MPTNGCALRMEGIYQAGSLLVAMQWAKLLLVGKVLIIG
jgi:hypothetical protein